MTWRAISASALPRTAPWQRRNRPTRRPPPPLLAGTVAFQEQQRRRRRRRGRHGRGSSNGGGARRGRACGRSTSGGGGRLSSWRARESGWERRWLPRAWYVWGAYLLSGCRNATCHRCRPRPLGHGPPTGHGHPEGSRACTTPTRVHRSTQGRGWRWRRRACRRQVACARREVSGAL
jgi:hypothetical protein